LASISTPRTPGAVPSGTSSDGRPSRLAHRLAPGEHLAGRRAVDLARRAQQLARALALGGRHPQRRPLRQQHLRQVRVAHLPGARGHHRQHLAGIRPGQQVRGHVSGRLQPPLAPPRLLVEAGVLHRDAGRGGQRDHDRLVLLVELAAAALLGQVQVAEHLVAHAYGHAEKRAHRRMAWREPVRLGVVGDAAEPQRPRVLDEQAEQPQPVRPVLDPGDLLLAQPPGMNWTSVSPSPATPSAP
jgi:hypothetical protein